MQAVAVIVAEDQARGPRSPAADHDAFIRQGVKARLSARRIWQDLVAEHGYLTVPQYGSG